MRWRSSLSGYRSWKTAPTYHTPGRPLGDAPACHVSPVAILSPLCQDMRLR